MSDNQPKTTHEKILEELQRTCQLLLEQQQILNDSLKRRTKNAIEIQDDNTGETQGCDKAN